MTVETIALAELFLTRRQISNIDDVIDHISALYGDRGRLDVFYREDKVRGLPFREGDTEGEFLYFPRISFSLTPKQLVRYADRDTLKAQFRRAQRSSRGQHRSLNNWHIFHSPRFTDDEVSAIATLLVSFYVSSDVYEHHIDRTARRFALSSDVPNSVGDIVSAIRAHFPVMVGHYTTPLNGREDASNALFARTEDIVLYALMDKEALKQRAFEAWDKGETYSGRISESDAHYYYKFVPIIFRDAVANTDVPPDSVLSKKERPRFERRKWGVLALVDSAPIDVFCFAYAAALVEEYVGAAHHATKNRTITKLADDRAKAQLRLLRFPFRGASDQSGEIDNYARNVCTALVQVTPAHSATIRLLNPFNQTLEPVGSAFADSLSVESATVRTLGLGIGDNSLNAFAFKHVAKGDYIYIEDVRQTIPSDWWAKGLTEMAVRRPETKSELCLPIFKTGLVVGVLNVEAATEHAFDRDLPFIVGLGDQFGDFIDLVTRSSDAGWLPRLSFYHFAAHHIEQLRRKLRAYPDLWDEFASADRKMSIDYIDPNDRVEISTSDLINKIATAIEGRRSDRATPWSDVVSITGILPRNFTSRQAHSLEVILENIIENASKHDSFRSTIQVNFETAAERSRLVISYSPSKRMEFAEDLDRVGIAPRWDQEDGTYHLGMFLVGIHVRLLGGMLWIDRNPLDEPEKVLFRYVIHIPLD